MSKCVKFESWLCPEIKQFIVYQEIRHFSMLVNKCIIYDEDNRARSTHYKISSEKKNGNHYHGNPADKGKYNFHQKTSGEKGISGEVLILPLCVSSVEDWDIVF